MVCYIDSLKSCDALSLKRECCTTASCRLYGDHYRVPLDMKQCSLVIFII